MLRHGVAMVVCDAADSAYNQADSKGSVALGFLRLQ
jgi:hypothetical protein